MSGKGKALTQTLTVKRNEHEPESLEVIAAAIINVADALDRIRGGKLTERAVLLLLRDITGLSMSDIGAVLNAAPRLRQFVRKTA